MIVTVNECDIVHNTPKETKQEIYGVIDNKYTYTKRDNINNTDLKEDEHLNEPPVEAIINLMKKNMIAIDDGKIKILDDNNKQQNKINK